MCLFVDLITLEMRFIYKLKTRGIIVKKGLQILANTTFI